MLERTRALWAEQDQHSGDRHRLFTVIGNWLRAHHSFPDRVLYPGSWVDVAASFVFPHVTYVDTDRRARQFFADTEGVAAITAEHGAPGASYDFVPGDYRDPLPIADESCDLLISLYAGFVSEHCTRYLRRGGHLLANSSHGDASIVAIGDRFELVAVIRSTDGDYKVSTEHLDRHLVPERPDSATRAAILDSGRGIAYTASAFAYLFRLDC